MRTILKLAGACAIVALSFWITLALIDFGLHGILLRLARTINP